MYTWCCTTVADGFHQSMSWSEHCFLTSMPLLRMILLTVIGWHLCASQHSLPWDGQTKAMNTEIKGMTNIDNLGSLMAIP